MYKPESTQALNKTSITRDILKPETYLKKHNYVLTHPSQIEIYDLRQPYSLRVGLSAVTQTYGAFYEFYELYELHSF